MNKSVASRASNASSKMLEEIANRSQTKIYKVQGTFNDQQMRIIWNSLGLYVSRNLRMGRGVNIPKLGIFTFTPPQVSLKGVTNEINRDQQPRNPVFLIQKDFVKGLNLRTAIFYHQQFGAGLRPYSALGATGEVPITKMNLIQIASYANMTKDSVQLGLNRIIKYMSQKLHNGQNVSIQIPNLGQLICRNNLVAVRFNQYIQRDTRNILSKSVDQRKLKGNMSLTSDNLKRLANITHFTQKLEGKSQQFFQIDQNAKRYLQSDFDLHLDQSNLKRSVTNFDRTVATKAFNKTNSNLKESQLYKISKSGFFNRQNTSKQFNMALKIVREWVMEHGYNTEQGFQSFCNLINKKSQVLNENQLWNVCKKISIDITEQQAQQLFRILDNNKDGFITIDDWRANIHFNQNNATFKNLLSFIQQKKYTITKLISLLGFQGIKKVNLFTLKNGIMKLNPKLSEEDALIISKHISQGKSQIQVEKIINSFNITESLAVDIDKEWQNSFFNRLRRKLNESGLTQEELTNKFRLYDKQDSGFIQQTDLKTVLGLIGISINLTQLIKIVKFIPINKQNKVNYQSIIEKLQLADYQENQEITESQFKRILKTNILQKFPYPLPISVSKLTALLQAKYFKKHAQKDILEYVRAIDLNSDELITEQDLKKYKQETMDKKYKVLSNVEIENLLIRLRERSIKKKISYYDIFRILDKMNSGFITKDSWYSNIDQIISFNQDQKQNLFNFMDKNHSKMIDYKTFLSLMNGNNNVNSSEQFDWVENTIQRIKSWFKSSNLTIQDAFKILDNDGDTYINQKDLHNFLINKLKLQERQINMMRTQKIMKLMDHYKHGRITYLDWYKLIHENKDWLKDVKQQIGIILSKQYSSLSDAFCQITQGENRMVFKAFEKWIKSNHILSGFMTNQDMIRHIFSHIDHHKKGYLLQNDFIGEFGSFDWKSEHTKEFIDFIALKFKSSREAFKYFSEYSNKSINFQRFKQVGQELFGNRFHASDLQNIWQNISGGKQNVDFNQFNKLYGYLWNDNSNEIDNQFPKDSWVYQDFSIIKGTTVRSNEHKYQQKQRMENQCQKFINNLKDILATSPKTLEQVFSECDKQKTGRITNLMFKKAFRLLNIALTSKQIDLLLNYCSFKPQTLIDWRHFIKLLNIDDDKIKIQHRIQPKIQHLSDLLHYYMISPKDAFRKWNNPRSGYLSFQQFHKMLKELFAQASQNMPEYQQLQDMFNFIDIRKDNQLDFQEFTQVFRNCNPPNLLMGTTPAPSDQLLSSKVKNHEENKPIREKQIPLFRHSQQYQKFIHLIGRNRKYIQDEIEKCNSQKTAFIPFSYVQNIIQSFCGGLGVHVNSGMIRNLIAFAMTGQKVDYHLLVNKFKDLNLEIKEFPKKKIF